MIIKSCEGFELEKESKQSPEDSFTRSVVTFELNGREKRFYLLYLNIFGGKIDDLTPFDSEPLFTVGNRDVAFKDIAALVFLIQNPGFQQRKRVYIHDEKEFKSYFEGINFEKLKDIFETLEKNGSFEFKSSIPFLKQPHESKK
jgi:hypothetical protein